MIFDTTNFPEIEKKAKAYTKKQIQYLIESWIMIAEMHMKNKKKLREHLDLFKELQEMTNALGGYVFYKQSQMMHNASIGTEYMIADREYEQMEKELEKMGVPQKHTAGLLNTFIQTEIIGENEEIETMIFGKTIAELDAIKN